MAAHWRQLPVCANAMALAEDHLMSITTHEELAARLRAGEPHVAARVADGRVLLTERPRGEEDDPLGIRGDGSGDLAQRAIALIIPDIAFALHINADGAAVPLADQPRARSEHHLAWWWRRGCFAFPCFCCDRRELIQRIGRQSSKCPLLQELSIKPLQHAQWHARCSSSAESFPAPRKLRRAHFGNSGECCLEVAHRSTSRV